MVLYTKVLRTSYDNSISEYIDDVILSPKVTQSIGENNVASSFTFVTKNLAGLNKDKFQLNDKIDVWIGTNQSSPENKIFNGFITEIQYNGENELENITITCKDGWVLTQDQTIEPVSYRNQEASNIIKDLVLITGLNVTTNNVLDSGIIIPEITFKHLSVAEAFKQIAEKTGYIIYIDVDFDLHFEEKDSVLSNIELKSGINIYKDTFTQSRSDMANKVWVYGGKILTKASEITFISDGIGSVYTLPDKPSNTDVKVNGTQYRGEVYEFANTLPSGVQYLVDYNNKNIIMVSGTTAGNHIPISGGSIIVNYDRNSIIAQVGQDDESIKRYGIKEDVIFDDSISTTLHAQTILLSNLQERSDPYRQGIIYIKGSEIIQVGRSVLVQIPYHNINDVYNILQVTYDLSPNALLSDKVQIVKVSRKIKTIIDTIQNILTQLKLQSSQNIDIGQLLSVVRFAKNDIEIQEHWEAWVSDINNSFIIGHPINGVLGVTSPQPILGNYKTSGLILSGGDF